MRFYEFATAVRPVLKISQQQQANQAANQSNTLPTPFPANKQPTPTPASINVYPEEWQHKWVQKYLAAKIARNAQTVKPTELDMVKAQMMYADAKHKADQEYAEVNGNSDEESGWQGEHRWRKRK
jgi:hypothetical protein